jgi:hypothetical protein
MIMAEQKQYEKYCDKLQNSVVTEARRHIPEFYGLGKTF